MTRHPTDAWLISTRAPFLGRHVLIDGNAVRVPEVLNQPGILGTMLADQCRAAGCEVLDVHAYSFQPQGVTAIVVLAESHAAIHTYPEHAAYMLDVFTCGEKIDPMPIAMAIAEGLGGMIEVRYVQRGRP